MIDPTTERAEHVLRDNSNRCVLCGNSAQDECLTKAEANTLYRNLQAELILQQVLPTPVVSCVWTTEDVLSMIDPEENDDPELADMDPQAALDRAEEWGRHIEDTANSLISEQLSSCVRYDMP